ncbi:MAG: hypothetical protein K5682_09725 [Lachnospiraceae bacterium]|nr:hypothetical protein [Lachnospiraceae bacterium]
MGAVKRLTRNSFIKSTGAILLAVMLTGCSLPSSELSSLVNEPEAEEPLTEDTIAVNTQESMPQPEEESSALGDQNEAFEDTAAEEDAAASRETGTQTASSKEGGTWLLHGYYYNQLSRSQQKLYDELYEALAGLQEEVLVSTLDTEELYLVYQCVMSDHPEIFYCEGYNYRLRTVDDVPESITFSGKYIYTEEEIASYNEQIAAVLKKVQSLLPASAGDYQVARTIYEYIIENTDYVIGARDNQNLLSVLLWGESVCTGYAKAYQYLSNNLGVKTTMVTGVAGGNSHAWNLVRVEGEYYHVDPTWGDPAFTGKESAAEPMVGYGYLLITDEEICRNHSIDNVMELPACNARSASYFQREGRYITGVDPEQLSQICKKARENGETFIQLKACNAQVYEALVQHLIADSHMFDYVGSDKTSYSYLTDEVMYTISFEL